MLVTRRSPNCSRGTLPSASLTVSHAASTNIRSCTAVSPSTMSTGGSSTLMSGLVAAARPITAAPKIEITTTAASSAANGAQIGIAGGLGGGGGSGVGGSQRGVSS
jgi:hypothetical protein